MHRLTYLTYFSRACPVPSHCSYYSMVLQSLEIFSWFLHGLLLEYRWHEPCRRDFLFKLYPSLIRSLKTNAHYSSRWCISVRRVDLFPSSLLGLILDFWINIFCYLTRQLGNATICQNIRKAEQYLLLSLTVALWANWISHW